MAIQQIIALAFGMGIVGSFHCLGMCGPIAMALPMGHRSNGGRLLGGVLYNLGRVFTYAWFGLLLGFVGDYLITPQLQSIISILIGAVLLLYLFLSSRMKLRFSQHSFIQKGLLILRQHLAKLLYIRHNRSLFGIGMLNGLLPCGMVYLALAFSFSISNAWQGSLFMIFFGLGTFPVMLAAVFFGSFLNIQIRMKLRKLVPVFLFFMAALLMLRGLNLGIPYLSPSLPADLTTEVVCH